MPTILTPRVVKHYTFNGHPVSVTCEQGHGQDEPDALTLKCPECALPFVTAQCVLLMATLNIRRMTVDGADLVYSHLTTAK